MKKYQRAAQEQRSLGLGQSLPTPSPPPLNRGEVAPPPTCGPETEFKGLPAVPGTVPVKVPLGCALWTEELTEMELVKGTQDQ